MPNIYYGVIEDKTNKLEKLGILTPELFKKLASIQLQLSLNEIEGKTTSDDDIKRPKELVDAIGDFIFAWKLYIKNKDQYTSIRIKTDEVLTKDDIQNKLTPEFIKEHKWELPIQYIAEQEENQ